MNSMGGKILLYLQMSLRPFTGGSIVTKQQHCDCHSGDADTWNDEGHPPCDVRGKMLTVDQRVEDSWHEEVSDTTS